MMVNTEQPYCGSKDNRAQLQKSDLSAYEDPEKKHSQIALQAVLDVRKGKGGAWKRHYVVFNLSDKINTIVCHRPKKLSRHPTKLDPVALYIPAAAEWFYAEADHKGGYKRFIISIPTGKNQKNEDDMDDFSLDPDMTESPNHVRNSYDKDYAKAEIKNKPLRYHFRFTSYQTDQEANFWLHTLETGYVGSSRYFTTQHSSYAESSQSKSLSSNVEAEFLAKKKGRKDFGGEFQVKPEYAYPNTKMNRDQLRAEMNKESAFYHDLRVPSRIGEEIGLLRVEVLQCIGLPKLDKVGEGDVFIMAACGSYAFRTDIIQGNANPMWLSKMRRACTFPLFQAYSRLYLGVFDDDGKGSKDDFAGRIALDIARMRPDTTYDVTLPLRESTNVYTVRKRGALRLRFHVSWYSQRAMVLSYLPKTNSAEPNENTVISCCDTKSFENIARLVHGRHMQGKFSMKVVKALIRELNFTRIHVTRYMVKREARRLLGWHSPFISGFVFVAWMHSTYANTIQYFPGHLVTLLLLYLWRNYAQYAIDNPVQNGFLAPTWEEIFCAAVWGKDNTARYIEPMHNQHTCVCEDWANSNNEERSRLFKIADTFRRCIKVGTHRHHLKSYKNTFTGIEAVDCLVNAGCAKSREEAVKIGLDLSDKLKLFEHVTHEHLFMDKNYYYRFLDSDENKYILRTHKPWGRPLFRLFGFINNDENFEHDQLEMPFSTGIEHPRITVKGSLVIRRDNSKSENRLKKLDFKTMQSNAVKVVSEASERRLKFVQLADERGATALDFDMESEFESDAEDDDIESFDLSLNEKTESMNTNGDSNGENIDPPVEKRKKPPLQNVDITKKADKPIKEVVSTVNAKVRGAFLNVFNDKTYVVEETSDAVKKASSATRPKSPPRRLGSKQKRSSLSFDADSNDKLLKTGIYSNPNKYVAKLGSILLPLTEVVYQFMYLFRALFNIVTWRDPILTFWVTIFGPIVVIILHLFPWRLVLAILGVALFGPQNWVLRVIRERKGIFPPDFDTIPPKKTKVKQEDQLEPNDQPVFTSKFLQNKPLDYSRVDTSAARHINVPHSPLMYHNRFYDWPPEKEFARVEARSLNGPKAEDASPNEIARLRKSLFLRGTIKKETKKKKALFRRRKKFKEAE